MSTMLTSTLVSKRANLGGRLNAMKKKTAFVTVIVLSLQAACLAQTFEIKRGSDIALVPPSIKYPGQAKDILRWTDRQGDHLLIFSEMLAPSKEDTLGRDAEIFAGHYLKTGGQWALQWKVTDFERDCPVDVGASFIPQSVAVTDLDNNHIPEVSFMYRTYCIGGVDPHSLKLIMYEGKQKFAIRGETVVNLPDQPVYGGSMKIDISFKSAPRTFEQFAVQQWQRNRSHPLK